MDIIYLEILIILILVLLNGIFALSEIAIITSRKIKLQKISQGGIRMQISPLNFQNHQINFYPPSKLG